MRALGERERELEQALGAVEAELGGALRALPNLPAPDAADEDTVVRTVGEPAAAVRRSTISSWPAP